MLSDMESDFDGRQALLDAQRAAAAPYVDYPRLPAWYPPAAGLWGTAFTATQLFLRDEQPVFFVVLSALVAIEVAFMVRQRRSRGTMPSMRGVPQELRWTFAYFALGVVAVLGAVIAGCVWLPAPFALVLTFVLVTAGVAAYERQYATAAAAVRARLR